jgi:DNA-binding MarR family transcriptional regulator
VKDRELTDALMDLDIALDGVTARVSREFGMTPQQATLLCLVEAGCTTPGELARLLQCDKTNVTGLMNRLERRGLIQRTLDEHDRRVTRVVLSGEGPALLARYRAAVTAEVGGSLRGWPADRRAALANLAHDAATRLAVG